MLQAQDVLEVPEGHPGAHLFACLLQARVRVGDAAENEADAAVSFFFCVLVRAVVVVAVFPGSRDGGGARTGGERHGFVFRCNHERFKEGRKHMTCARIPSAIATFLRLHFS